MKIPYKVKRFRPATLAMIDQINEIVEEYAEQGYDLTLRQLYYQFVSRDLLPNNLKSYSLVQRVLNDGRMAGMVRWDRIVDRTRNMVRLSSWGNPADYIMAEQFHMNRWATQDNYCEVWIEKEALVGVISGVCTRWDVPYFACRGYVSQSESWRAGQRIARALANGKHAVVFHLGDHDPSGVDMTRDNQDRLDTFDAMGVDVKRLALNMDQVEKWNPPPNPAKLTDSRADGYIAEYGNSSWELDALEPREIEKLIERNIRKLIDKKKWQQREDEEEDGKDKLRLVQERWDDVVEFLEE